MNKFLKIIVWICLLTLMFGCAGCKNKKEEPKPILKVITSSQVGTTIFSNKQYYIVYDNGKTKKVSQFSENDVFGYAFNPSAESKNEPYLHMLNTNTDQGKLFNNYAKNIVYLTDKDDSNNVFSPAKLLVIDNHLYFTAMIKTKINTIKRGVFEYLIDDNTFTKVAVFKNSITHVEAYK